MKAAGLLFGQAGPSIVGLKPGLVGDSVHFATHYMFL
jgi:hypothetical protein